MLRPFLRSLPALLATACAPAPETGGTSAQAVVASSRGLEELTAAMNDYAPSLHDTYVPHYVLTTSAMDASAAELRTEEIEACHPVTSDDARAFLVDAAGEALPWHTDVEIEYERALEQWTAPLAEGTLARCGYRYFADSAYEGVQTDFVLFRVDGAPAVMFAATVHWN